MDARTHLVEEVDEVYEKYEKILQEKYLRQDASVYSREKLCELRDDDLRKIAEKFLVAEGVELHKNQDITVFPNSGSGKGSEKTACIIVKDKTLKHNGTYFCFETRFAINPVPPVLRAKQK